MANSWPTLYYVLHLLIALRMDWAFIYQLDLNLAQIPCCIDARHE